MTGLDGLFSLKRISTLKNTECEGKFGGKDGKLADFMGRSAQKQQHVRLRGQRCFDRHQLAKPCFLGPQSEFQSTLEMK